MDKSVAIFFAGTDEDRAPEDRQVAPGTRALDVLRDLGLAADRFQLRNPKSGRFFRATDDIYEDIDDKLEVVPGMPVGERAASAALSALRRIVKRETRSVPLSDQARKIAPQPSVRVQRIPIPLIVERGWARGEGGVYKGFFRLPQGNWEGELRWGPTGFGYVRIKDPPEVVRSHEHFECLRHVRDGWWHLHFSTPPTSPSAAIMAFENFLAESFATRS